MGGTGDAATVRSLSGAGPSGAELSGTGASGAEPSGTGPSTPAGPVGFWRRFAGVFVRLWHWLSGPFIRWGERRIAWGKAVWARWSKRRWVAHLVRAGERFSDRMGNQFAGAITYFSFLSLVPILMVAFAVAGFLLSSRPDLLTELQQQVTEILPTDLAESVGKIIDQAVGQRLTVGIIGLLVAAYSGLNWMGNVREAVRAQWRPHWERSKVTRQNFLRSYLWDLLSLFGLAVAVLVSVTLTAVGSSAQKLVADWLGLDQVDAFNPLLTIGPILIAMVADVLIFGWIYTIIPYKAYRAERRTLLIGAFAMSVCFEVLKAGLSLLVSRMSQSPSGVVFGSLIGLLFFFNLAARIFLFVAAWIATGTVQDPGPPGTDDFPAGEGSGGDGAVGDGGVGDGSVGDGAAAGRAVSDGALGDGSYPAGAAAPPAEPERPRPTAVFGVGVLTGALWQKWRERHRSGAR